MTASPRRPTIPSTDTDTDTDSDSGKALKAARALVVANLARVYRGSVGRRGALLFLLGSGCDSDSRPADGGQEPDAEESESEAEAESEAESEGDCKDKSKAGACEPAAWSTEYLEPVYDPLYAAIAIDAAATIHLAYYTPAGDYVRHAERTLGGDWTYENVDVSADAGDGVDIAADADGGLHLAHAPFLNGALVYMYRPCGGAWVMETVVMGGASSGSIAVDNAGIVHIAYYDATGWDLTHAMKTDDGWSYETIDAGADEGAALVLDTEGTPHVAYGDWETGELWYAVRSAADDWTLESVTIGTQAALAVDDVGGAHISYHFDQDGALKYAYRPAEGGWTPETVDGLGYAGQGSAIVVDDAVGVHITYDAAGDIGYAYRPAEGSWSLDVIDLGGAAVGHSTAVALVASGGLHVSYFDLCIPFLKYAYACP